MQRCWHEGPFSGPLSLGVSSLDLVCMHHKLLYIGRHHHFCSITVTKDHPGIKCSFFSAALKQSGVKWEDYQLSSSTIILCGVTCVKKWDGRKVTKKKPKNEQYAQQLHVIIFKVQEMLNKQQLHLFQVIIFQNRYKYCIVDLPSYFHTMKFLMLSINYRSWCGLVQKQPT